MNWRIEQRGSELHVIDPQGKTVAVIEVEGEGPRAFEVARAAAHTALAKSLSQVGWHLTAAASSAGTFRSEAIPEGVETSDGRIIDEGATEWRTPPLPLMLQTVTEVGHYGAELAGRINAVVREGNQIVLTGDFDDSEAGRRFVEILEPRGKFGISVDLGRMDYEVECLDTDDEGFCIEWLFRVTKGELIGATGTPFPAFADAYIELSGTPAAVAPEEDVAAAAQTDHATAGRAVVGLAAAMVTPPMDPPAEWFTRPDDLDSGFRWITVTADGRIYGYVNPWGVCHIGYEGVCMEAPPSRADYAYFMTGEVHPDDCDCDPIPVGRLTMGTGHAGKGGPESTVAHYDDTGTVIADIACGADAVGTWYSGALRPSVTEEQVRALRAAEISGDWRRIAGNLELVAALVVNVGGFKVARAKAIVAGGQQVALIAAGHTGEPPSDLEKRVAVLERQMLGVQRIATPLIPQSAAAIVERVGGNSTPARV